MIRINLLPVKRAKKRGSGKQQVFLILLLVAALGILLVWKSRQEEAKFAELVSLETQKQAEIKKLEELIGNLNETQKKSEDLQKKLGVIETLQKSKSGPVRVLDEISTLIPKKVWLTSMGDSNQMISMAGFAIDSREIANFMKNLEADTKFFSDVTLGPIAQTSQSGIPVPVMAFSITLKYKIP